MRFARVVAGSAAVLLMYGSNQIAGQEALHWYRCSTHTHTRVSTNSDVNETPEFVAEWYRSHGYQCLVITDHEFLTDVAPLNRKYAGQGDFLLLPGQEITQVVADPHHPSGVRHAHVNGININRVIEPIRPPPSAESAGRLNVAATGVSVAQTFERNLAEITRAGGLLQVNHPNLLWSLDLDDLLPIDSPYLMEIWNAFPTSNNLGGKDDAGNERPSTEALWDALLSRGKVVWGVASDDAHEYHAFDDRETPTPGKGWIVLQASTLTIPAITEALREGHFYASTGISLESYSADRSGISIRIKQSSEWSPALTPSARYLTRFVGVNGKLLAEVSGLAPQYRFRGDERYVRASISDSDGRRAWTQPMFVNAREVVEKPQQPSSTVDQEGTVRIPALAVPYSSLASGQAKRNFIDVTSDSARMPAGTESDDINVRRRALDEGRMRPVVERLRAIFRVTVTPETIGGVHTDVIEPAEGVTSTNTERVLINLHGGGFAVGARYGGQQEAIPIASLGKFKVITVDYRMAPEHKFPAASEDVAAVYKALLQQYQPENIGIYGCSSGGMLTAQAAAWFQVHGLPRPGAVGIFGSGAAIGKWGDSNFVSAALNVRPAIPSIREEETRQVLAYFSDAEFDDRLVSPAYSLSVLSAFPPALIISGTRDDMLSAAVYTHAQLVKAGVEADLHVWEGATHCAFAQPIGDPDFPENREAWDVIVRFFEKHLGTRVRPE